MEENKENITENTEEIPEAEELTAAEADIQQESSSEEASEDADQQEISSAETDQPDPEEGSEPLDVSGTEERPEDDPSETEAAEGDHAGTEAAEEDQQETEAAEDDSAETEAAEDGQTKQYGLPADHPEMGELRERIEHRKKEKKKKQRRFHTWVYVTAIALMLIVFGFFFSISGFFTTDSIVVEGNKHYTSEEIINMSHAVPGRNLIYHTNKKEIVGYLEQNPYIRSAKVVRRLPSTLVIIVDERSERMAFKYDDDYLVMDGEGILLKKTRNAPQTTIVEGLIVNKIKLGEKIGTEDKDRTDKAIDLISSMTKADLYFVKLDVSDMKRVKAYIYDNMLVRADYDTLMTNIKNGHLHQVVSSLFEDGIKRGTITFDEDGSASFMPII